MRRILDEPDLVASLGGIGARVHSSIVLSQRYDRCPRASLSRGLRRGESLMLHTNTNSAFHDFLGHRMLARSRASYG